MGASKSRRILGILKTLGAEAPTEAAEPADEPTLGPDGKQLSAAARKARAAAGDVNESPGPAPALERLAKRKRQPSVNAGLADFQPIPLEALDFEDLV